MSEFSGSAAKAIVPYLIVGTGLALFLRRQFDTRDLLIIAAVLVVASPATAVDPPPASLIFSINSGRSGSAFLARLHDESGLEDVDPGRHYKHCGSGIQYEHDEQELRSVGLEA